MRHWWILLALVACSSPTRPAAPSNVTDPSTTRVPTIVVQLAYRGTFMIGPPFSYIPPFTLLDDGTLIGAVDADPVTTTTLPRDEVERIVHHIRTLGFERLESHTDTCKPNKDGTGRLCVTDATYTILRVALAPGQLREVTTYAEFSNEPEIHQQIVDYLTRYKSAHTTPYRPTSGVLHVHVDEAPATPPCPTIDPAILRRDPARTMWAFHIEGADVAAVLAIAPSNRSRFAACAGNARFQLMFVPAVPGADLSAELEPYNRGEP